MRATCTICHNEFNVRPYDIKRSRQLPVCSIKCKDIRRKQQLKGSEYCCCLPGCQKKFYRAPNKAKRTLKGTGYFFCCKAHQQEARFVLPDYKLGPRTTSKDRIDSYRKFALSRHGSYCAFCHYDVEVRMLDVHHIDGNRKNNCAENLIVLCTWCHALVTRRLATIENRQLVVQEGARLK